MKIVLIIILISTAACAQNFFPLEVNNRYQLEYTYTSIGPHGGTGSSLKSYRVIADSIIEGNRFFRFNQAAGFNQNCLYYYNQEEQKAYVKRPEYSVVKPAIDFNIPAGEWFPSYIYGSDTMFLSKGVSYMQIFGEMVKTFKMISSGSGFPSITYIFAENLGLYTCIDSIISGMNLNIGKSEVVSAIIDTFYFNPVLLNITSFSPLINRPVSAFPFSLQSSYYTNLSCNGDNLVDSFYTELIQIRDEDTIGVFTYPFNSNNYAYIILYPQAGDRLITRAVISDTSIFDNYDTFPDSGYAEILVLPDPTLVAENEPPGEFSLRQNFPNPFNPNTVINYTVPLESQVTITVYDISGSVAAELVNEIHLPGTYNYSFSGGKFSSGIYFYRMTAVCSTGTFTEIKKMQLVK